MFLLEPEQAHGFAMSWLRLLAATPLLRSLTRRAYFVAQPKQVFGIEFPNTVGLAAGFDKNAEALGAWEMLGFGFVEIGTITAKAQPGNPRPRCFRYPEQNALINRMGFNNDGADVIATRLQNYRDCGRWPTIPIGINIGKSKVTELADAPADYLYSFLKLRDFADYFVINVSSPNTPGLRSLQSAESLRPLLMALQDANSTALPILVKIAPDLDDDGIDAIIELGEQSGIAGLIATNTTLDHSSIEATKADQQGGLSGLPLATRSTAVIERICARTSLPVIASGGVMDTSTAAEKMAAGASLIQLYTGFIYSGPTLIKQVVMQ